MNPQELKDLASEEFLIIYTSDRYRPGMGANKTDSVDTKVSTWFRAPVRLKAAARIARAYAMLLCLNLPLREVWPRIFCILKVAL